MDNSEMDAKKIGMLAELQEAMGNLYHIYSERSPEFSQLWSRLADDKFRQVIEITSLLNGVRQGKARLKRDRFHVEAIRSALQSVRRQISSARKHTGSFKQPFSAAISIESAIIDRKFFEAFESDTSELKELAGKWVEETKIHLEKLKAEILPK